MRPGERGWIGPGGVLWSGQESRVLLKWARLNEWGLVFQRQKRPETEHVFDLEARTIDPNTLMQYFTPDSWGEFVGTLNERIAYRDLRSHGVAVAVVRTAIKSLEDAEGIEGRELRRLLGHDFGADDVNRAIARLTGPYLSPSAPSGASLRPTFLALLDFPEGESALRVVDAAIRIFHERSKAGFAFMFSLDEVASLAGVTPAFAWRTLDIGLLFTAHDDVRNLRPPRDIERIATCSSGAEMVARLAEWATNGAAYGDPHAVDRAWQSAPIFLLRDGSLPQTAGWQQSDFPSAAVIQGTSVGSPTVSLSTAQLLLASNAVAAFGKHASVLVDEINKCFTAGAYTPALVSLRRLLEGCIITVFERYNATEEIRHDGEFRQLKALVNALCNSPTIRASRSIKDGRELLQSIRWLGGVAAHSRYFVASESAVRHAALLLSPYLSDLEALLTRHEGNEEIATGHDLNDGDGASD